MKKFLVLVFLIMLFVSILVPYGTMAAKRESHERTMTVSEFNAFIREGTGTVVPYVETCCDRPPNLKWRQYTWHIVNDGTGICVAHKIMKDQYCTWCGSIWQEAVYVRSEPGCGKRM